MANSCRWACRSPSSRATSTRAGDLSLLIVDWVIEGRDRDGNPVHIEGTATDVARRCPDGHWRYIIDNPFGTAAAPA